MTLESKDTVKISLLKCMMIFFSFHKGVMVGCEKE